MTTKLQSSLTNMTPNALVTAGHQKHYFHVVLLVIRLVFVISVTHLPLSYSSPLQMEEPDSVVTYSYYF